MGGGEKNRLCQGSGMKGDSTTSWGTSIDKEKEIMEAKGIAHVIGSGPAWYYPMRGVPKPLTNKDQIPFHDSAQCPCQTAHITSPNGDHAVGMSQGPSFLHLLFFLVPHDLSTWCNQVSMFACIGLCNVQ